MFKKTLVAILCSAALVACGGGSSDSNPTSPGVVVPSNDLDKAKQLVNTTNGIIAYFQDFEKLGTDYQLAFAAVNDTASDVGNATGLVVYLASLAYQDAKGANKTYNAAELDALLKADSIYEDEYGTYDDSYYQLSDSTLTVQVQADSVSISGTAKAKYWAGWQWDSNTSTGKDIFADEATIQVANLKLSGPFIANSKDYKFTIAAGGKVSTENESKQKASFTFKNDSTAQAAYTRSASIDERTDDERPTSAEFKFSELEFATNNNVVMTLNEFSSKAQAVTLKTQSGSKLELIPTELKLNGTAQLTDKKASVAVEAAIKLNNTLTGTIDVSKGESVNNFVNAIVMLKVSGEAKGVQSAVTPFIIDMQATRAEYQKGSITADVSVGKDKLKVESSTTNFASDMPTFAAKISHSNGAYVQIADVTNFNSADIKVGNTVYGTIAKQSNSLYSAVFTDKSIITIAP